MDKAMWDRIAAAGGIIGVILFVIGIIIVGTPPELGDNAATVANFFQDNRDQVLWGGFLQGLGVLAIIWFIAALGAAMRDAGEGRLAAAMGIGFAITVSIGAVAALTRESLAFSLAEEADADLVWSLYQMSALLDTASNVIAAAVYLAVGGAIVRTGLVATWWGWLSTLAGLWAIISATAWAHDGFWSADGAGFISFIVFLAWALITSVLLTMKMREGGSAAAA